MNRLDPLIEGYLDYLLQVGRKAPRTVTDVRCTLRARGRGPRAPPPGRRHYGS